MSVFRKLVGVLLAGLLLGSALNAGASTTHPAPQIEGQIKPTGVQREATEEIVDRLQQHYLHLKFDDALSRKVLNQYLKDLDPNHLYFTRSDIGDIQSYRNKLDDQLEDGVLEGGFTIFNRFQTLLEQRLTQVVATLKKGFKDWQFDPHTEVELDRTKADWAPDQAALDRIWDNQLKNAVLSMRLNGTSDKEIQKRLVTRYESQLNRARQNTPEDVFQTYMNALAQSFDPHTTYFSPHNSENFDISMSRSLEGIGAVLQYEDGYTKVVRLIPGGPAAKDGRLKPADRIVGVGQGDKDLVNVIGMRLDEVVDKIRGPKGTRLRLEVVPSGSTGEHNTRIITLTRNKVLLKEQEAKKAVLTLDHDGKPLKVGVIEIPAFYLDFQAFHRGDPNFTSTTRDVARLLLQLRKDNIDALIIDLRNNGGGSLLEVNKLVSLFINRGPTVQVREADGQVTVEHDQYPGVLYAGPMAVLVNRYSASASEIFTGAMQDYGRALIVGSQTYGKGTVQTLLDLNHGKLKMTSAKFYRVSGSSNQNLGIIPDLQMPTLIDKKEVGESTMPNAMPWDEISPAKYTPMLDLVPLLPTLRKEHQARIKDNPEFLYVSKLRNLLDQARSRKEVSLDISKRRSWQEHFDQQRLAIENAVRQYRHEKPLKDMQALRDLDEKRAEASPADDEPMKKDAYLKETGQILGDMISLLHQPARRAVAG